ncbi:MAG: proprotein convertase P-domain-containing protein [Pirellulales bacterium]
MERLEPRVLLSCNQGEDAAAESCSGASEFANQFGDWWAEPTLHWSAEPTVQLQRWAEPTLLGIGAPAADSGFGRGPKPPPPGPGASATYASSNVPVALVDADLVAGTLTATLSIPDSFVVADVNVSVTLSHTFDADLAIQLISPDGTTVDLLSDVGGDGDNFNGTVLDDEAPTPIALGDAPFAGRFAPLELLQAFDGQDAQGAWSLRITDNTAGDTGTLTAWSLTLRQAPSEAVPTRPLGVSPGVTSFKIEDEITTFGGEDFYAVELTAGQRISASVQTPTFGGNNYINPTDVEIPDDQTPVTSSITIASSFPIDDLDVQVLITHDSLANLDISLITPSGERIALSTDNGGSGDLYFNTTFDDEAEASVADASAVAPFAGRWRPESPLSAVDGDDIAGTWRLEVTDDELGDSGSLLAWGLRFNQGLDSSLRIFSAEGELAENDDAIPGIFDSAVVSAVVPTTGTYYVQVGTFNHNVGPYTLELGIYDESVAQETGDVTDLNAARAANNGNAAILGLADGIGETDVYTTTLAAGESVVVAVTTPGGFYDPRIEVSGPDDFTTANDNSGPDFDSILRFTAPADGLYTITVEYASAQEFLNTISEGSYTLTLAISDNAANDGINSARPISVFDYREPVAATSEEYGVPGFEGVWIGEIDSMSDVDYFSLGHLPKDELIGIFAQRRGDSQLFASAVLVNSADEIVMSTDTTRSGNAIGSTGFEIIVPEDDTYYLRLVPAAREEGGATLSTGAYTLFYAGFGRLLIETDPPVGTLVSPVPGSLVEEDPGFVDIAWTDGEGSGVRTSTIDQTDVSIAGVTVFAVEDRGGGVWRYLYGGTLPPSVAQVVLPAGSVTDFSGNGNLAATFSLTRPPLGTAGDDVLWLRASANGERLEIYDGDPASGNLLRTWSMDEESVLQIETLEGSDQLVVQLPAGVSGPPGGIQYNAGLGANTLSFLSGAMLIDSVALPGGTLNTTIAAGGRLTTTRLRQNGLALSGADSRVTVLPGAEVNLLTSLEMADGSALDISDNALVVDYSGDSPAAAIRDKIIAGRGGPGVGNGTWTGAGLTSSTAAAQNANNPEARSLGYAENAALPLGAYTTFRGQAVDDTAILIAFTPTGDVNLDGLVNDDDTTVLGASYAPSVATALWELGDFEYNGFVDDDDATLLGAFYMPTVPPMAAPQARRSGDSLVQISDLEREIVAFHFAEAYVNAEDFFDATLDPTKLRGVRGLANRDYFVRHE